MRSSKLFLTFLIVFVFLTLSQAYATPKYHLPKNTVIRDGLKVHFGNYWISTSGTDITITTYFEDNWLNYTSNAGTQQIHNGTKPSKVYFDDVQQTEGVTWSYADGTITVTPSGTNVGILWGEGNGETNWWQMTFNHLDLDSNVVDTKITWKLYNTSQELSYTEGEYTLLDGSYTLKTYYLAHLINQRELSTANYGNTTITCNLNMKAQTHGYVAFNDTISTITIYGDLVFTVDGSTSNVLVVAAVPRNITHILMNGENVTDWTYSASPESHIYFTMDSPSDKTVGVFIIPEVGQAFFSFWIIVALAAAIGLDLTSRYKEQENFYLKLAIIVVIEDMFLRILPILILDSWIPLWTIFILSVIMDAIAHAFNEWKILPERLGLATAYNSVWFSLYFVGGILLHPAVGMCFGLLFHYLLDLMLTLRKG